MKKLILIFTAAVIMLHGAFAEAGIGTAPAASSAPAPFEPAVVKAFADSLYNEGFLSQAEGEYKRYLFSIENVDELSVIQKQDYQTSLLSLCNIFKSQNDKAGVTWIKTNFFTVAEPSVKEKMNNLQAGFIFKERQADAFSVFVNDASFAGCRDLFSPEFVKLVDASELLLKKDITALSSLCADLTPQFPRFQKLADLSLSYKKKSPGFALFLSMILPGSGKWYTGSFGAFISSFLSIGTFVAGTVVTGIQTNWKSWQPYVFGACGLVLYITDLYGSYQSVKRYNEALFRILCEETDKLYEGTY